MSKTGNKRQDFLLILIAFSAFISLGLPDGLSGVAWPYMCRQFNVPLDSLGVLLISYTTGCLCSSILSGKLQKHLRLGLLLSLSCGITAFSLLVYAITDLWYVVIAGAFFMGSGGGAIDSAVNNFAASHFSASVVNWLHAFYGIGATAGPLLLTIILANKYSWHYGFYIVGAVQIFLAVVFLITQDKWKVVSPDEENTISSSYKEAFGNPVVWLSLAIFFLYTGIEIGFGQWIYTVLIKSRGMTEEQAGLSASAYWGSLTGGRIASGIILKRISVKKLLVFAISGILTGNVLVGSNLNSFITLPGILLAGLSCAPVFPCLIALTPGKVGKKHSANVIGLQISAAMIGGAVLPGFAGLLMKNLGLEVIPLVFIVASAMLLMLYIAGEKRIKNS